MILEEVSYETLVLETWRVLEDVSYKALVLET